MDKGVGSGVLVGRQQGIKRNHKDSPSLYASDPFTPPKLVRNRNHLTRTKLNTSEERDIIQGKETTKKLPWVIATRCMRGVEWTVERSISREVDKGARGHGRCFGQIGLRHVRNAVGTHARRCRCGGTFGSDQKTIDTASDFCARFMRPLRRGRRVVRLRPSANR
jgi:hypothetical protein